MLKFHILTEPKTKKNSQQIARNPKTGAIFVTQSKTYKQYEKDCALFMPRLSEPIDRKINVQAVYYRKARGRADLCNLHEALCDVLVKYGVVKDDDHKIIASMDGSKVLYDKDNPRTEVTITFYEE